MNAAPSFHNLDFFVFGVPLVFFLIVAFFRLDNLLLSKAPRPARVAFRPFAKRDTNSMFTDPDGRPWD
jgi:hypothetical protein